MTNERKQNDRPKRGRKSNAQYLYTVYRNSDDKLMILDGAAKECAKIMGLATTESFYRWWCVQGGYSKFWTVYRASKSEVLADMEDDE